MQKNSPKNSICSSDWDLSVESLNVAFRALVSAQITCIEIFFDVRIAISHVKRRFWRMVWRKTPGKNSKCSSD